MGMQKDCCFCDGNNWFRYRVGAIIISEGYALFSYGEECGYYYTVGGGVHMGERSEDAVLREVFEETGEKFVIERPLCLIENFFKGTETLEGLDCHAIEFYYLMRPAEKKEYSAKSVTTGGEIEKMCWLPIERIDEYDVRPAIVKNIIRDLPPHFTAFVNDERQ
ncbi:MAG: NUDIX hydrolase [Oscillospiraceae bacterium]